MCNIGVDCAVATLDRTELGSARGTLQRTLVWVQAIGVPNRARKGVP